MSETTACLVASIAVLIFILLAMLLFRLGRFAGPSKMEVFRELVRKYSDPRNDKERRFIWWLSFPMIFRAVLGLLFSFLSTVASAVIIGGVCGRDSVLGKIVWDLYERWFVPSISGQSPPGPPSN